METVNQDLVRRLIEFAPKDNPTLAGVAEHQLDGTVALFNMLARNRCAYLADEVGMGKTYVALGVMSLLRHFNPKARIVIIAPRENIQRKWVKELRNFVRVNWQVVGNRVKSLQGEPAWEPVHAESLVDFVRERLLNDDRDFFLRMSSFSLALKQADSRRRHRRLLREQLPWLPASALSASTPEAFRDQMGVALNAGFPRADLLIVDEAHNLKHGFSERGSIRNRVMGLAFGHPDGRSPEAHWFKPRVERLLLLSATPFEEDYAAVQRQLEIFGFGDAKLVDPDDGEAMSVRRLLDRQVPEEEKREIVGRLMVRRVSGLTIGGVLHTKNMYRREWRRGGYALHDEPMHITEPRQRLVVGLMQKKVAEILQHERFNNSFQIGMLSSFESFLETIAGQRKRLARAANTDEAEDAAADPTFDGDQGETDDERRGIDTDAIARIVASYRERFGSSLPHPKLDNTADAFQAAFETGEKTLVFVRRVRTVDELADKLDQHFDRWIRRRMLAALPPELAPRVDALFEQYERERTRRTHEHVVRAPVDEEEPSLDEPPPDRVIGEDDEGGSETFFSWFFRGVGPQGVLSGAAFQKNRLSGQASVYTTLFEDDYVAWLLDRPAPASVLGELGRRIGITEDELDARLRDTAYAQFTRLTQRESGYPRTFVFQAYQMAALSMLEAVGGEIGHAAGVVLDERFTAAPASPAKAPRGFPGPGDAIGITTFFTELVQRPELRQRIWPEDAAAEFRSRFRRREQRRELISAMCRLGAAYIDLYLLAIGALGSLDLRQETQSSAPESDLAVAFVDLLGRQMTEAGLHAFAELSRAAETFDLLVAVNFPNIPNGRLGALSTEFARTLQRQVPVGRMSGGVNKRLVRQFRMPGFPLVLICTDVLQEGEDLHTFCRRVVHYGITWTPSAMEQRTGRVDRIGSLVQRELDGQPSLAEQEKCLQVYYPHLQSTVEVLQVRRVLRRLTRFLQLIHNRKGDAEDAGSRLDVAREMLEELDDFRLPAEPLESAFPVRPGWRRGRLGAEAVEPHELSEPTGHLDDLWAELQQRWSIRPLRAATDLTRRGFVLLNAAATAPVPRESSTRGSSEIEVRLDLRSQASGDLTLLRCTCEVGPLDLRDDDVLDELYDAQKELGAVKVCVRPHTNNRELVTVEGDLPFGAAVTQVGELELLVSRTATAASRLSAALILVPSDGTTR